MGARRASVGARLAREGVDAVCLRTGVSLFAGKPRSHRLRVAIGIGGSDEDALPAKAGPTKPHFNPDMGVVFTRRYI
jgi:hypothetical protein